MPVWIRGERVKGMAYDSSRGVRWARWGTVMRTVNLKGKELVEVLLDTHIPNRAQSSEIVAFNPDKLWVIGKQAKENPEKAWAPLKNYPY